MNNTGIESLSVDIPENVKMLNIITKMPNIIKKATENYRQCAQRPPLSYSVYYVLRNTFNV